MAVSAPRKKLIEVSIPLEAINAASAREKSIRHGHPSTLHLWWARRPLAACRAVLFAQLVDDPSSWPDRFPTEEDQDAERRRLHKIIENMVPWEASNNERILNEARWEIARSVAWGLDEEPPPKDDGKAILDYLQTKAPPVYDPFSGGGSIPLEAQRLGLRAYGSDLNPVAVLIGKALVEIPPKFAGLPPVNPESRGQLARGGEWNGKGAQGLAEDVRYYGKWMRDEAEKRIGHLYPKAKLPDGSEATVIAWLWARTVRSPDPAAKGAMVPLVSSFMLSTKEGKKAWVEMVIDPTTPEKYRFQVRTGVLTKANEERLKKGTKAGQGQAFTCVLTGSVIDRNYVQVEGKAGRLGLRLLAVVAEGRRGRVYLSPRAEDEAVAASASGHPDIVDAREEQLSSATPTRAQLTGGVCSAYGLRTWGHLFTDRQLIALTTLTGLVKAAREAVAVDALAAEMSRDLTPLRSDGEGAVAYADAVATYLAISVSRQVNRGCTLNFWDNTSQKIQQVFGRQAFAMTWDFAETNFFSNSTGNFLDQVEYPAKSIASWVEATGYGFISQIDAPKNSFPVRPVVISTDPPYYDNIGYATLSDFFYVWLRPALSGIWPELFRRLTTPKDEELVATSYRHASRADAETFFMRGIGQALGAMRAAATEQEPLAIYYAFKQSESSPEGVSSAGWASFLQGIIDAGLLTDGTWPIRTELTGNLKSKLNVLASSIVLVCRKRPNDADVVTRAEFVRALKRELPDAIENIRKAGVGPVDMQQSVIGPGMGVFSRYAKVLEDDDSPMSVKTALSLINRVWEDIENELDANFDSETQVALAWFATYGFDARPSGELIVLATAKNTSDRALFASGVFKDMKGKAGLTPREELPSDWTPSSDNFLTIWECVQHTARVLKAADGGAEAAARLVAQMGPKAADAQKLAYRLFEIATNKKWAAEALVYNELAEEWPKLEDLASNVETRSSTVEAQVSLF
jgi:putative DNA methylase